MSYFLWIEDFENSAKATASNLFGGIVGEQNFSDNTRQLKKYLKEHGVFIELSFQDGLGFVRNNLNKIDYIILDIDLPACTKGDEINDDVLQLLEKFHDYKKLNNESGDERFLGEKCEELKKLAGYYIYAELVIELGFPKEHILFCSNHGENLKSIQEAFRTAKITLPTIYKKSDYEAHTWVVKNYGNPYSQLRRGVIEGCRQIRSGLQKGEVTLSFKNLIKEPTNQAINEEFCDYLTVLEKFFPLFESNKFSYYKLFIRTLSHEWEAADPEKFKNLGLPWIMKNTRNWVVHNSSLFNEVSEKLVAYLFIINMRVMFDFDESVQPYERILLNLFADQALPEALFKDKVSNNLIKFDRTYLKLKNIIQEEKKKKEIKIKDGFYFNELANNIQQSNSHLKYDTQLFANLLYQMFWLTTSVPYVDTGSKRNVLEIKFKNFEYLKKPCIRELARHIYNVSCLEG